MPKGFRRFGRAVLAAVLTLLLGGLVMKNKEVFSSLPGHTHHIQHDIITPPGYKGPSKTYRVPEAKRAAKNEEVGMLELEVIKESHSAWSSLIVLVSKPDGTVRLSNDFRKLNAILNAYPMPRIDEMIERLGNTWFISTLDLTKEYW